MLNTALVLNDSRGREIFRILQQCPDLELVGVADLSGDSSWLTEAERKRYFICGDIARIMALPDLHVLVNAADSSVAERLKRGLSGTVELVNASPGSFVATLLRFKEQLLETRRLKGELGAVLNAVQDAIEVVDSNGIIKYVNPAFTRVTGIPENKRVNRNIFEESPDGALAQSLIKQKPVTGYRTRVGGSEVEVISNASPIIVDGEITGAVVVFQPVSDILKLMDQLKHSNTVIESLYAQIDRISSSRWNFDDLAGQSKIFRATVEMARKAARSDAPVLLSGESGTGKNAFAHAIHNSSSRKRRPMIVFDCSTIPESLQELELFGCEKGALPGVVRTHLGKVELAHEGTLFIKEINSLKPFLQEKLLLLLQERQFCRIGSDEPIQVDLRVIASANGSLKTEVLKGYFSEKLYRYLSKVEICLPPLRKRLEDLPVLAQELMAQLNRKMGKRIVEISPRALQEMAQYEWPGNISELKNAIERSLAVADGNTIEYHHLAPYIGNTASAVAPQIDEIMPLDKMEQMMLKLALTRYGDTLEGKKKAAQALNISLAILYNKLKKYNGL
ncbi:MAG TPA: sigma 54-interacting transcriptional regulator [Bacillota bacterium]|nr:sigma 54-interacting transcriptional regulator [Bacillota bacterium]